MSGAEAQNPETSNIPQCQSEADKLRLTRESQVYTATRETLFPKEITRTRTHALSLDWVNGVNSTLPVYMLQDHNQLVFLYAGAHVAIIYNHTTNSQHILEGHSSSISCLCVSQDRRWIATADLSTKSTVIIWDSYSGIPVNTLFDCHRDGGVIAIAFSGDTKQLVTLGNEKNQCVCVWAWTNDSNEPLWVTELIPEYGYQNYIIFNPNNSTQLLSTSISQVLFYSTAQGNLQYVPLRIIKLGDAATLELNASLFPHTTPEYCNILKLARGPLNPSVFHWQDLKVLTPTMSGIIMIWDLMEDLASNQNLSRDRVKVISLQDHPITLLTVTDSCIVTGDTRGHINFYDENMLLLTWYNQFNLDTIASISFSKECSQGHLEDCTIEAKPLLSRNFVVATVSSMMVHVNVQKGTCQVILQENCDTINAVACHPTQPLMVMGNHKGTLKVWDYEQKRTVRSKVFEKEKEIQCVMFDPQGRHLAVGFGSGAIHFLDPNTLQSNPKECFDTPKDSISHMSFSSDSRYLATVDVGKAITIFRSQTNDDSPPLWIYLGRYRSHYKPIADLLFGVHLDGIKPRLFTLGMDRMLVEYDLENSDMDQIVISSTKRIEQSAVPKCMTWYPPFSAEQFVVISSDQYKMKLFNSTTKKCRKTLLGPTYGSPVKKMEILPTCEGNETGSYYMAYITDDKLGLQILPLDGNPFKSHAVVCHPTGVSTFAYSHDGRFLFTAGGGDCTVLSWQISYNALEGAAALGGKDLMPFYTLLEGGKDGKFYREIEDFFYYCQIHNQGLESMDTRQLSTKIPLTEVIPLMRALAYFPTEEEVEDMLNEIKLSKYAETGEYTTDINLEELIKLYINHRPAFGISISEITEAFRVLGDASRGGPPVLPRNELLELLQVRGEAMTEDELAECFTSLLGFIEVQEGESPEQQFCKSEDESQEYSLESVIPEEISMKIFTDHILGLPPSTMRGGHFSQLAE
uniref:cilia- and flagella-associated protein 251 isoform X1 n=1 Tax=Doryrhamphus excisus TaxID=161450 RepID=UPI0025AE6E2A|nr:cilia- and flagella-associated protein 251 isoform X1 [Doryrhamphus excisus]XP_057925760.1 cilia- and flagella-associated protein 251 isoform X1 [Doryrhamphus excisus]